MKPSTNDMPVIVILPPKGFEAIDFAELGRYRDLFYFLVLRDVKVLYAQTILGFAWAILNPAIQIILFTVIFGKIANVPTDGIPYFLFSTVAIIPWSYMSEAMNQSSQSLVSEQGMLGKVYFPRMIFPLTPVLSKLVDFIISLLLLDRCFDLLQGHAHLEHAALAGVCFLHDAHSGGHWHVAVVPRDSVPGCQIRDVVYHSDVDLHGAGAVFGFLDPSRSTAFCTRLTRSWV